MVPISEELTEEEWLQAGAQNPAFDFLADPEEDIYTLEDGKPFQLDD
jgi:hypothetical protein